MIKRRYYAECQRCFAQDIFDTHDAAQNWLALFHVCKDPLCARCGTRCDGTARIGDLYYCHTDERDCYLEVQLEAAPLDEALHLLGHELDLGEELQQVSEVA